MASSRVRARRAQWTTGDAVFAGRFEWFQALLAAAALIALWKLRLGVMAVLGASALIGLAWTYAA